MPYSFNRTITIDHTKVPNTDQSNFPMLFAGTYSWLATVSNGGDVQNSNGYDIIFTSDSGGATQLDHEIESYSASDGKVSFWVRIPTLSHTADTVIYIWYGNSSISTSQENATAVWDSNYKAVYHCNITSSGGGPTYTSKDSTANGHNATRTGGTNPASASGKINGCHDPSAGGPNSSDLVADTFSDLFNTQTVVTVELWVKSQSITNNVKYPVFWPATNSGPFVIFNFGKVGSTNDNIEFTYTLTSSFANRTGVITTSNPLSNSTWYHVVAVIDISNSGNSSIYFNGGSNSGTGSVVGSPGSSFSTLGSNIDFGYDGVNSNGFDGQIDELRFSTGARSGDWATASYNSQNSPSTFYSITGTSPGSGGAVFSRIFTGF